MNAKTEELIATPMEEEAHNVWSNMACPTCVHVSSMVLSPQLSTSEADEEQAKVAPQDASFGSISLFAIYMYCLGVDHGSAISLGSRDYLTDSTLLKLFESQLFEPLDSHSLPIGNSQAVHPVNESPPVLVPGTLPPVCSSIAYDQLVLPG
jgi:hypothetical protein